MGSIPALKTKIPHAKGRGQKNEKKIHGDLEKTTSFEFDGLDSTSSCPVSAEGLTRQGMGTRRMCQSPSSVHLSLTWLGAYKDSLAC